MNKSVRLLFVACVALLWTSQRLPAPIIVLPDEPAKAEAPPKKKKRVVHTVKPTSESKPKADGSPAPVSPSPTPEGDEDDKPTPTPSPTPEDSSAEAPIDKETLGLLNSTYRKTFHPDDRTEAVYIVTSSKPLDSKENRQQIRFIIYSVVTQTVVTNETKTTRKDRSTQRTSIFTGRMLTLAQLTGVVRQSFRRFANGPVTSEQVLGQIGEARSGGELKLVAESDETLRFDYTPKTDQVFRIRRADVQRFLEVIPP